MLYVILGVLLGLLVSLGPLSVIAAPFDLLVSTLVSATTDLFGSLFELVGVHTGMSSMATAVTAVFAAIAPGTLALVFVSVARQTRQLRRRVAMLLIVLALVSFFVLPATSSFVLLGCAILFGILAGFFEGVTVTLPLTFLATVLAVRYGVLLWEGGSSEVWAAAEAVSAMVGTQSTHLWQLVFTVLGLFPFVLALKVALRSR